eukprot:1391646-Amorphochlora_amoeboformis.AAC.1
MGRNVAGNLGVIRIRYYIAATGTRASWRKVSPVTGSISHKHTIHKRPNYYANTIQTPPEHTFTDAHKSPHPPMQIPHAKSRTKPTHAPRHKKPRT